MRIRQEIKIKFLSAAMVVLLIFSGIFGGIGYRAYAAQTTYPENDTVTISDNETENKYPEITPESTSYLYCYNQLATWDSGETMQRYYKDLRDICWDFIMVSWKLHIICFGKMKMTAVIMNMSGV